MDTTKAAALNASARTVRRLSILSNVVPTRLKGVGYHLGFQNGVASVVRLTQLKIEPYKAVRYVRDAQRARGQSPDDPLTWEVALDGFVAYAWDFAACAIPLTVGEVAYVRLFHDSQLCTILGVCGTEGCPHTPAVAGATASP